MLELDCLRLSQDKFAAVIIIHKAEHRVTVAEVRALISRSDYSEFEIDDNAVIEAVEEFNALLEESAPAKEKTIRVALRKNAELHIEVADDKMSATATITAACGGEHITIEQLNKALEEAKVTYGILTQESEAFLEKARQAEPKSRWEQVVANGLFSKNGVDSQFERLVQTPKERLLKPQKINDNRVDMRDLGELSTVAPGTPVMQRIAHEVGYPGKNVLGSDLPYVKGKEREFNVGEGTKIAPEDPNLLVADMVGLPIEVDNGMRVDNVFSVPGVNVATGHVNFSGSVMIKGDVQSGMQVRATGDIHVGGFVESCYLEAGGDILIQQAIIGQRHKRDDKYSCEVHAKGSIHANNAQYSLLSAEGEITIFNQLNHCHVETGDSLTVANMSGTHGLIVGGHIEAANTIRTVTLGSTAGSATYISIEGEYEELRQRNKALQAEQKELHNKINEILDAQLKVNKIPDLEKRRELRTRLDKTLAHYRNELSQLSQAIEEVDLRTQAFLGRAKVIASKAMYPNINLNIAGKNVVSNRQYGPTQSKLEDYTLSFEPL